MEKRDLTGIESYANMELLSVGVSMCMCAHGCGYVCAHVCQYVCVCAYMCESGVLGWEKEELARE